MQLKSIIFIVFCFAATAAARAFPQQDRIDSIPSASEKRVADTSTLVTPGTVNDLKKGFKNLFTENEEEGNINRASLNPKAISFVEDYVRKQRKKMEDLKSWGRPYFDMIDAILTQYGIPKEMKYLAVIESHLKTYATSWAGAVGPWQFMPATARRMGLRVTNYIDERTDYVKSTRAAARYLKELYGQYEDWLLVIAAYNGGPGNVNSAIRKSGSRDFWELQSYLPLESRNHVKKFIATHYIMEGDGGITTLTRNETEEYLLNTAVNDGAGLTENELKNTTVYPLTGRYNSVIIAKHLAMDITEFNKYNPDFDRVLNAKGNYDMRLSIDKMDIFKAKKVAILNESIQLYLNSISQPLIIADKKTSGK